MKDRTQIQQQVETTMQSIDGIVRAGANPYLFTRIRARLQREEKTVWSKAMSFMSRPSVAIPAVILAVTVNVIVVFKSNTQPTQASQEGEQLFATEYNLADNTIYDSTIDPE
jgi:hypothetical protein